MRNNTKILRIVKDHDINLSLSENGIDLLLFNKISKISCVIEGRNLTIILDKAMKIIKNGHLL